MARLAACFFSQTAAPGCPGALVCPDALGVACQDSNWHDRLLFLAVFASTPYSAPGCGLRGAWPAGCRLPVAVISFACLIPVRGAVRHLRRATSLHTDDLFYAATACGALCLPSRACCMCVSVVGRSLAPIGAVFCCCVPYSTYVDLINQQKLILNQQIRVFTYRSGEKNRLSGRFVGVCAFY